VIGSRSRLPDGSSDPRQGQTLRKPASAGGPGRRYVVGIGELAVGNQQQDVIITHALGSCIAVCVWDPIAQVGGLLHFLLPDSKINLTRAVQQPATYADTGVPLLLQEALQRGAQPTRMLVHLVGGAEIAGGGGAFNVGKRNLLAARNLLWRHGVLIKGEEVGGSLARTVHMDVGPGRIRITSGLDLVREF